MSLWWSLVLENLRRMRHSLNTVLESLIPFIKDNKEAIKLPTFLGRKCLDPVESSEATSSKIKPAREGKDFAWSRGLGVEISPIKMRSCRKKLSHNSVKISESAPSSSDIGPLRALKALARAK
jgi:hypothetical protein